MKSQRHRGFSLIELTITLVVIATIAAIAVGRYGRSLDRYRAESAGRRVEAEFQRAVAVARGQSAPVTLTFDVAADRILIPLLPSLQNPTMGTVVELAEDPYRAEIVSADFEGFASLTINGYGNADRGGSVTVGAGDVEVTVTFDKTRGEATMGSTNLR